MFSYINEQDRQNSEQIQVIKEAQINSKKDIEIVKNDVGYIR
jgi:heme-binding NEAT domain protein